MSTTIARPPQPAVIPASAPSDPRTRSRVSPMGRIRALILRHGHFVAYAAIGVSAVVVDVSAFAILATLLGMQVLVANGISTGIALVYSFVVNSFGNFKVTDRILLRFLSFSAVAGAGFIVSSLMIAVSVGVLAMDPIVAKAITLPVVLVLQFTLNKTVTFGSRLGRTAS